MHHFLISFDVNKDGVSSVHASYYASAKSFSFEEFWKLSEGTFIAVMRQIYPSGFTGNAKALLESFSETNPEEVVSAFIKEIVTTDLVVKDSPFSPPGVWYSIRVLPCDKPVDGTLEKVLLTQSGVDVWSFKNISA